MSQNKNNILVLFAHPSLHHSSINRAMLRALTQHDNILVNDLYEQYPEHFINVQREQSLLEAADLVVFHHPFYWYSSPSIIKLWQDVVLEKGFAYGPHGKALKGKYWLSTISTAASHGAYNINGNNKFTIGELLAPLKATANLCGMHFLPPVVIHNSTRQNNQTIESHTRRYIQLLEDFRINGVSSFNQTSDYLILTE